MLQSKKMLGVARTALEMMEDVVDSNQVEVLWIASITALRAVGHVLSKTDKNSRPEHAHRIDLWWNALKCNESQEENKIFFDFINSERNNTIKEFKIHYDKQPQTIVVVEETEEKIAIEDFVLDDLLYIPMVDGPYEGEDVRDLICEAIAWWEKQFNIMQI